VNEVTIYALSTENIENRDNNEIETLFNVFAEQASKALDDERIHENGIHVNVCGDKDFLVNKADTKLGRNLIDRLNTLEEETKNYSNATLNLAIAYGGRQEIINATKKTLSQGLELNEENIRKNLWVKDYPEIMIRTSEDRISNFLLWQSAYSEIYFVNKLWQEFQEEDLHKILGDYNSRERRFGR